jgi:diazepam-binding inhibitor (GABA receptor modulating acyl-CoA-binding protein)
MHTIPLRSAGVVILRAIYFLLGDIGILTSRTDGHDGEELAPHGLQLILALAFCALSTAGVLWLKARSQRMYLHVVASRRAWGLLANKGTASKVIQRHWSARQARQAQRGEASPGSPRNTTVADADASLWSPALTSLTSFSSVFSTLMCASPRGGVLSGDDNPAREGDDSREGDGSREGGEHTERSDLQGVRRLTPSHVVTTSFGEATAMALTLPASTGDEDRLLLYGLFKQATSGPPPTTTNPAAPFDLVSKHKWDAWAACRALTQDEAKGRYIRHVNRLKLLRDPAGAAGGNATASEAAALSLV